MRIVVAVFVLGTLLFSNAAAAEKVIHVFQVGHGLVGEELLHLIQSRFSLDQPIEVRVVGLANSKVMHFDPNGIPLTHWKERIRESNELMSIEAFIQKMRAYNLPHSIFVDCTSSQLIADYYPVILDSHLPIVTPNKKANSGSFASYRLLQSLKAEGPLCYLYDSTVGAGLPIIHTIRAMHLAGDSITKLEAILSGTLSFLFNRFDGSAPFSQVVREAQSLGYTEPDPREDLNGMDMARKVVILARESGLALEMSDVTIDPFLPPECFEAKSVSEFYERLESFDASFKEIAEEAKKNGEVLRFIALLEEGKASLSLKRVGASHPFYHLTGTDNIASIQTLTYSKSPVVIRGPGAGASVTASSILSNIIDLCQGSRSVK